MKTCQGGARGDRQLSAIAAGTLVSATIAAAQFPGPAFAADACASPAGRVTSVQGQVELRRISSSGWQGAKLDDPICPGDMVRVGTHGRAGLLLSNETTLRLDQNTALTVQGPDGAPASLLDVLRGAINVISRTPRPFKVRTPYVNASIEGTEFLVGVTEDSARVAVLEGRVIADNERGSVTAGAGEQAVASRDSAPRKEVLVRPIDAVQWALYFPTVFNYAAKAAAGQAAGDPALQESIQLYQSGRVAEAVGRLEQVSGTSASPQLLTYRAGLLLQVGRQEEVKPDVERALALDPRNSDARSLQAIIAVVQNQKADAMRLAGRAVELDPESPAAMLALSYAQQASFRIDDAIASVRKATELDPSNALTWARLAELEMSTGGRNRALEAAKRAQALDPGLAKTQLVLGFADLVRIDLPAAKAAFTRAIELDQADPLARLGLGLAQIRGGDLHAGREQIEIAVSLDPGNSLARSYMGKAYYEERRDKPAESQFGLAEQLDPNDPTPLFYGAILKQGQNRTVEAFQDVQKSIELNDNRGVFRSRLLLDEDRATQSAGLARIYKDLGFQELAVIESAKALAFDPDNYAAHLQLADAYSRQPHENISRQGEELQYLLREREINSPISALRPDDSFISELPRVGISRSIAPAQAAFNEFNPLFDRNRLSLYVDGIGGQASVGGEQVIASGIHDAVSFNLAQGHFETEGFGDNQNFRQNAYLGMIQDRVDPDTSLQAEVRATDTLRGDFFLIDPATTIPVQVDSRFRSARFGGDHGFSAGSDILVSAVYQTRDLTFQFPSPFDTRSLRKDRAFTGEFQWTYALPLGKVVSGGGHTHGNEEIVGQSQDELGFENLYAYWNFKFDRLRLQGEAALSADFLREANNVRRQVSPKLGFIWTPTSNATFRAAYLRTLKRPSEVSPTIEPTQLAGFGQFADDPDGTRSTAYCFGFDQRFAPQAHVGFEIKQRLLEMPTSASTAVPWRQRDARAYIYWPLQTDPRADSSAFRSMAMTMEVRNEKRDRPEDHTGDEEIVTLNTTFVPIGVTIFPAKYISLKLLGTHVVQAGRFLYQLGFDSVQIDQSFWLADFSAEYRIPGRRAIISMGASNLFNHNLSGYQEIDPANPDFSRGRLLFARAVLQL